MHTRAARREDEGALVRREIREARADAAVPTITCTSSNVVATVLQAAARPKSELARMRPNVLERDPALEASRAANNHEDIDALRELSVLRSAESAPPTAPPLFSRSHLLRLECEPQQLCADTHSTLN